MGAMTVSPKLGIYGGLTPAASRSRYIVISRPSAAAVLRAISYRRRSPDRMARIGRRIVSCSPVTMVIAVHLQPTLTYGTFLSTCRHLSESRAFLEAIHQWGLRLTQCSTGPMTPTTLAFYLH
jgi:hypothetical protein